MQKRIKMYVVNFEYNSKNGLFFLFFIVISFCSCGSGGNYPNYECKDFGLLYSKENKQDTSKLLDFLNSFIESNDRCMEAHLVRADLYFSLNELERAKVGYYKVLKLDTNNIYPFYELGVLYQVEDKLDSSILFLAKAFSKKMKGNIVIDFNSPSKELSLPSDRYDINSSEIAYQIGVSYYQARKMLKSLESFKYCINNEYKLSESYLYSGAIFYEAGKKNSACLNFNLAKLNGNQKGKEYIDKYCK